MPAEPPGIVPGRDQIAHWDASWAIYGALKWIGNPNMIPKIIAGEERPMVDRLQDTIKRTGEVR
jgi:hypothetical protein